MMRDQNRLRDCASDHDGVSFDCVGAHDSGQLSRRHLLGGAAGLIAASRLGVSGARAATENSILIDSIIGNMSVAEKAGQLFMIGATGTAYNPTFAASLKEIKPGGVI